MSEQYYTISHHETGLLDQAVPVYKEADIGWRWCKDELPTESDLYRVVLQDIGENVRCFYNGKWFTNASCAVEVMADVVQWCKLPEPLKELHVSGLKGEYEDLNGTYPLTEKPEYEPFKEVAEELRDNIHKATDKIIADALREFINKEAER